MTESASTPKYQVIANDLRDKIIAGTYAVGSQLPTKAELMTHYDVALNTVDRALDVLRDLGLIESQQGVGTFVRTANASQKADLEARVKLLESQVSELYELIEGSAAKGPRRQ
ncbi:winged helix-turn-helix transcriptional regulator [Nocardia tengchongensis]|uniref:Winged helix-turn-helix transcriptional regulator n=1 Tax=Nocardia tengchongensis TaxID=2055889 RepID=A0ABX8CYG0_9NOCA|nr:winged helix-turn-helix domain-containing protein [Nocardia tengchongensis]QVI24509.1 winged helix-turn-helix transcriptional regulator [Nocardia tengchongensis]